MPDLDDVRRIAARLPGSDERATTGGAAWFVRGKLYAWECHPWPSIPEDMREARNWRVRVGRISHLIADRFPMLIGLIRNPRLRASIEDTAGYFENRAGIALRVRSPLTDCLREFGAENAPILLIGHSLGSVIAYDALWTASHLEPLECKVDLFLSMAIWGASTTVRLAG